VALGLIKVFRKSIELLLPIIELNSVPYLDILLNLHSQDVHIQRHRHLISQTLNLFLFKLYCFAHVANSLLHLRLSVFARLHLFSKSLLVLVSLLTHLLVVGLELGVQAFYFLFFCVCALQMSFDSGECPLKLINFLA